MKRKLLFICAGTLLTAATVGQALAVTSSGTIGATLTLTNGCLINGSPTQNGINFGTLDFGTHPATFSTLTTQLTRGQRRKYLYHSMYHCQLHGGDHRQHQRDRTRNCCRHPRHTRPISGEHRQCGTGRGIQPL